MLTLVPTPIGNLEDISFRSLSALGSAELILCEDTRITKKLLLLLEQKFNQNFLCKNFLSFHHHNGDKFLKNINIEDFKNQNIVYVSDAGMPCISDPGAKLVDFCIKNNIPHDVLPGANAVLTAYALSGYDLTEFTFFGFLPHKGNDRKNALEKVFKSEFLAILYESPHRLLKLLEEICSLDETKEIFLIKEISKKFQRSFKDNAKKIHENLKNENIKGEWVVLIPPKERQRGESISIEDIQNLNLPPKQKAKLLAKLRGCEVKEVYQEILDKMAE